MRTALELLLSDSDEVERSPGENLAGPYRGLQFPPHQGAALGKILGHLLSLALAS